MENTSMLIRVGGETYNAARMIEHVEKVWNPSHPFWLNPV